MTYRFLSEEWFAQVKGVLAETPVELPEKLRDVVVNVVVDGDEGAEPVLAVYRGCWWEPGSAEDAVATLFTTRELAYEVIVKKKMAIGVRALSTGQAKLKGDRRKLLALRAVRPSPSQASYEAKVQEITTP
jgi:hypothetical protein